MKWLAIVLISAVSQTQTWATAAGWEHLLPGSHNCVLVIDDPVGHLNRAADLVDSAAADIDGSRTVLRVPKQYRSMAPQTLAVSWSSSDIALAFDLSRALLLSELAEAAAGESSRVSLRNLARDIIDQLELPELAVWMRFDNKYAPKQIAGLLQVMVGYWGGKEVKTKRLNNGIEFSAPLDSILPWDKSRIRSLGSVAPDEADLRALRQAAFDQIKQSVTLRLEIDDSDLLVRVGGVTDRESEGLSVLSAESLARGKTPFLQASWDLRAAQAAAEALVATWEEWQARPEGLALIDAEREDYWGPFSNQCLEQLRRFGNTGSARITCTDHLAIESCTKGHRDAESLEPSGLLDFTHEGVCFYLSTCDSAQVWFAKWLSDLEGRISAQTFAAEQSENQQKTNMLRRFSRFLRQDLAAFRGKVYSAARQAESGPTGLFVSFDSRIEGASIDFTIQDFDHSIDITNAAVPAVAIVSKESSPDQLERYFGELWRSIAELRGERLDADPLRVEDLGLEAPTKVFVKTKESPWEDFSVSLEGNSAPHLVVIDGWVIASTSTRLSERLLASYGSREATQEPVLGNGDGDLVAYGSFPSKLVGQYFAMISDFLLAGSSREDERIQLYGVAFEEEFLVKVLPGLSRTFDRTGSVLERLYSEASWSTRQDGDVRCTRCTILPR